MLSHLEDRLRILFLEFSCRNLRGFVMKVDNVNASIIVNLWALTEVGQRRKIQAK